MKEIMFSSVEVDWYELLSSQMSREEMSKWTRIVADGKDYQFDLAKWMLFARPGDVWVNSVDDFRPSKVFCHLKY